MYFVRYGRFILYISLAKYRGGERIDALGVIERRGCFALICTVSLGNLYQKVKKPCPAKNNLASLALALAFRKR